MDTLKLFHKKYGNRNILSNAGGVVRKTRKSSFKNDGGEVMKTIPPKNMTRNDGGVVLRMMMNR